MVEKLAEVVAEVNAAKKKHEPDTAPKNDEYDIYARDETFLDFLVHDLEDGAAWFNNSEFARYHDLDGRKILSIFTTDKRGNSRYINVNEENPPEHIQQSGGMRRTAKSFVSGQKME